MSDFPYTIYMLLFDALVAILLTVRNYEAFKKNNNEYNRMFYRMGFGSAIGLVMFSVPIIIISNTYIVGVFYIIGAIPLFWGLSYGVRLSLRVLNHHKAEKIFYKIYPFVVAVYVLTHFIAVPRAEIIQGVLVRNALVPFDITFAFLSIAFNVFPGIVFFKYPVSSRRGRIKKTLFAFSFTLGGIGGFGIIMLDEYLRIAMYSHFLLFFALLFSITVFIVDEYFESKEKKLLQNNYSK